MKPKTFYQRFEDTFIVEFYDTNGRVRAPSRHPATGVKFTEETAASFFNDLKTAFEKGVNIGNKIPIGDTVESFLQKKEKELRPNSYVTLEGHILNHLMPLMVDGIRMEDKPVLQITTGYCDAVREALMEKDITIKTVRNLYRTFDQLVGFINLKDKWGLERNYAKDIRITGTGKRNTKIVKPPAKEDISKVMGYLSKHNDCRLLVFLTLYETGMRISELVALRPDDVLRDAPMLHVRRAAPKGVIFRTKTQAGNRKIPLGDILFRRLKEHIISLPPKSKLLFQNRNGKMLNSDNIRERWFYETCDQAAVERFGPHQLRHFYRSSLTALGVSKEVIDYRMGHEQGGNVGEKVYLDAELASNVETVSIAQHTRLIQ